MSDSSGAVSMIRSDTFFMTRLRLSHFKQFDHLDIAFTQGINVVTGPNEEGKSTILDALIVALFYNPESRAA